MQSFTSLTHWKLPLILIVLAITMSVLFAQNAAPEPQALGLKPPTKEDFEWMKENMVETREVRPNKLGLDRINASLSAKGQPPINLPTAPTGQEVIGVLNTQNVGATLSTSSVQTLNSALPRSIDNSALNWFPPIRNQGSIGSCAAFSSVYYVGTHMLGLARPGTSWANTKNDADNTNKLSPKWAYPMVNGGSDGGSWFTPIFELLIKNGAATWSEWPYSGVNTPQSYREWCGTGSIWRNAISRRFLQTGKVSNVGSSGLAQVKALLNNGYVLLFATDIYGWDFVTVSNDPSTTNDDRFVGQGAARVVNQNSSGHAMTIVGYNDDVWIDVNKNGVVESAEKGALKIANSWGTTWRSGGFAWISYDALRTTSTVPGMSNAGRATAPRTAFWYNEVYWITARASYVPSLIGEVTFTHSFRNELNLRMGRSTMSASTPGVYFQSGAVRRESSNSYYSSGQGGGLPLRGGSWASPSNQATMAFDLTDLFLSGAQRYYVALTDSVSGDAVGFTSFRLLNASGTQLGFANTSAGSVDLGTLLRFVDLNSSTASSPAITSATSASATVGSSFFYQITATNNPTRYSATSLPSGLVLNTSSGTISGVPTQTGTFSAQISASNAVGTGSATLNFTIARNAIPAPVIASSATAAGTVGVAFSYQIVATNMVSANAPLLYGVSGTLPQGINFNSSTGLISGVPSQAGTFSFTITASNAGGATQRSVTLTVGQSVSGPVITSPLATSAPAGQNFTYRITATGTAPITFSASNLPSGLTVNAATGVISGAVSTSQVYNITITATNGAGSTSRILTLTITGDSSFNPSNDAFVNRRTLSGTGFSISASNVNATAEMREPTHAGSRAAASVWWTWIAPGSGTVTIDTLGSSFNTVLGVYVGTGIGALRLVAFNNDIYNGIQFASRQSKLTFQAVAGTAYHIAVDGIKREMGVISLNLTSSITVPENDSNATPQVVSGVAWRANSANNAATAQSGEPAHYAGNPASKSLWWSWTAPASGAVSLHTRGSTFDTVLAVYTGNPGSLTQVASDDDEGGNGASLVNFTATAGVRYLFAVDGRSGDSGAIQLTLNTTTGGTSNDYFAARTPLTLSSGVAQAYGTNTAATSEPSEQAHADSPARKSLWWSWTATSTGTATISTATSTFDTVLAVYTGTALTGLSLIAANDDASGTLTSVVTFQATSGVTYQIAVDGYYGASGNIALRIQPATTAPTNNNDLGNARAFGGTNLEMTTPATLNSSYTAQASEPAHAGSAAAKSAWWRWTPSSNGLATFTTGGSTFDTVLAIYRGPASSPTMTSLVQVAASDDSGGDSTSSLSFVASAGVTYYLAVDGYSGASGTISLAGTFSPNPTGVYSTDFENFPAGIDTLDGREGWEQYNAGAGTGATGTWDSFDSLGRSAWLGFNPPEDPTDITEIWRTLNLDPIATGRTRVKVSMDVAIFDSTNGRYDWFRVAINNNDGSRLGMLEFDNTNNSIWYFNGVQWIKTRAAFRNGSVQRLEITLDTVTKKWSAKLGGISLFTNVPFNVDGAAMNIADISFVWRPPGSSVGNNFMLIDNLEISAANTQPPAIDAFAFPQASVGEPFQTRVSATNEVTSFSARGLPLGLAMNSRTGVISGSPRASGSFLVTIRAQNAFGFSSYSQTLNVLPPVPTLPSSVTLRGTEGRSFSATIRATGLSNSSFFPTPFSASGLPPGITLNPATGVLSGVPTTYGVWLVSLAVVNQRGTSYSTVVIDVAAVAPVVSRTSLPTTWFVGSPASFQPVLGANSRTPTLWTASGLPAGMSINPTTGLLSGTPTQTGTFSINLQAIREQALGTLRLRIVVR